MKKVLSLIAIASGLAACVTINVNFPEGAAQKASDDFVRELYRAREKSNSPDNKNKPHAGWSFIPEAFAESAFQVRNEKTQELQDKMRSRLDELLVHKRSGVIGETKEGILTLKDTSSLKPMIKKRVEKIVEDENADRTALYAEVSALNHLKPGQVHDVAKTFANSFQAESPSGTWVESAQGEWSRKK
jgi:uncharacterized protein YdbL (DUF1318 family)